VGEGLQALAVKDALLARSPDVQVVYTFFSPSAEGLAERFGADVTSYLPWDLRGPIARVLEAVEPDLVVFTKTEVWPVLVAEARRRSVPVAIVGAAVPEGAGRMRWPARRLMRGTWSGIDLACANSDADGVRLEALGVLGPRVRTLGDPGIDSAASRFDDAPDDALYLAPFRDDPRPTVVAGSTWAADEAVLLPALEAVRADLPDLRVIIAPHEPDPDHVSRLVERLRRASWRVATLAQVEATGSAEGLDAVVVDRIGVLAHLYGVASVSFVGGGFHAHGLHSVLEPAAAGTPITFGPRHENARAAGDLVEQGGAKVAADPEELAGVLVTWLRTGDAKTRTGRAAARYIESPRGAAERTAACLAQLMHRTE
jgi:3-deoxy-D-manno-octulosonic-acid transferase